MWLHKFIMCALAVFLAQLDMIVWNAQPPLAYNRASKMFKECLIVYINCTYLFLECLQWLQLILVMPEIKQIRNL